MNDLNSSKCRFSADMVSYMYDELPTAESSAFEQHLVDCSECTDEFAAMAAARYEVYDWKKIEFDPLETPRFEIPYAEIAVGVSWSDRIRAVFASGLAVPTVSFAALAIVAFFAASLLLFPGEKSDVAQETPQAVEQVPAGKESAPTSVTPVPDEEVAKVNDRPRREEAKNPRPSAKRVSAKPSGAVPVKAKRVPAIDQKQTTARNERRTVPTLNEFAEDEDNSLRLAELFEDIGSR